MLVFGKLRAFMLSGLLLVAAGAWAQSIPVAFTPDRWTISQRNFKLTQTEDASHNGELGEYRGRDTMRVSKGLFLAKGVELANGTIDVDMAPGPNSRFFGVAFHIRSDDDYEVIFFRPRSSGTDQAVQYTPVFKGAPAWQIYSGPGSTATANIVREQWTHVRIVIAGPAAKLYLDNAANPTLVIPDLKLGAVHGSIGFWGHMGDAYFANLTYTPDESATYAAPRRAFLPGALTDWSLSEVFDVSARDPAAYPEVSRMKWEGVEAEAPGMVVINRYRRSPNILPPDRDDRIRGRADGAQVVFAKTTIHSDREQVYKMNLGYSDEVVVFLNGKPIFAGNNTLSFREPSFLGILDSEPDAVYLSLKRGANELVLAVTEFFGGWGFFCRLDVAQGSANASSYDILNNLRAVRGQVKTAVYRGKRAVLLAPSAGHEHADETLLAMLPLADFKNGVIEAEIAGAPKTGVPGNMRGFIGIAFHMLPDGSRYDRFFLRPANGRTPDQLRRNHTAQYDSLPEYPWDRLRKESPGQYESYADVEPGTWTKIRIVVSGASAQLYVNGAEQPALVVTDLKSGNKHGQIGLWAHSTTDAYFSNVTVKAGRD